MLEAWGSFEDRRKENEGSVRTSKEQSKRLALHYAYYASQTVQSVCDACTQHWLNGDFVSFSLTGRLIVEYAASIHYILAVLSRAEDDDNWTKGHERIAHLALGGRRPYWLEPFQIEQPKSVNILTRIKQWSSQNASAEDDYAFISEVCHPNHLQHYYFFKAGKAGDLGTSIVTEHQIKVALERLVSIVQNSTISIGDNLEKIIASVRRAP
ncbi:MAG: hypothetical protein AAGG65_18470 [Pseudomonadota bacterium]